MAYISRGAVEALQAAMPHTEILPLEKDGAEEIRTSIKDDPNLSMISVSEKDGLPYITVTIKDFMSGISQTTAAETLSSTYLIHLLTENGVTEEMAALSQSSLPSEVESVGSMNVSVTPLALF